MKINIWERDRESHRCTQDNINQIGHETVWNCMYTPKYKKKDFQRSHSLFNIPLVKAVPVWDK